MYHFFLVYLYYKKFILSLLVLKKRFQTLQELRMLSTVTLNFQVTKIVMNSGSQLSELELVSQLSQVSKIFFAIVFLGQVISSHHSDQMSQRSQVSRIAL